MSDIASFPVPQVWDVMPDPSAIPAARRPAVEIARFWRVPLSNEALRDAELCTSELVANAMEHTRARCRVAVRWTGERLRVEVADSSARLTSRDRAQDLTTSGRGLILVEALSHSWGWHPLKTGKVVWFECAADQPVTGDSRRAVLVDATRAI